MLDSLAGAATVLKQADELEASGQIAHAIEESKRGLVLLQDVNEHEKNAHVKDFVSKRLEQMRGKIEDFVRKPSDEMSQE